MTSRQPPDDPESKHLGWYDRGRLPHFDAPGQIQAVTFRLAGSLPKRLLGRTGTFWHRDYFDRYIRSHNHLAAAIVYIENNPVKAGLVRMPEDWPWSSARTRKTQA